MRPPIEALKGRELNALVDQYMRDGVETDTTVDDLRKQEAELLYIHSMARAGETRLDFDEYGMVFGMIRCVREAITRNNGNQ